MALPLSTLVHLQVHGIHGDGISAGRTGGAGPAFSKAFLLGDRALMLPVDADRTAWQADVQDGCCTFTSALGSLEAQIVPTPRFYELSTKDGISYKKIALLHGKDCLASTVLQTCSRYANPTLRCRFCSLGKTLDEKKTIAKKTPEQLAEVAVAAKELDHVSHVTLTSGTTTPRDKGILYMGQCAKAITAASGLPVQLQFEPPEDFGVFATLKAMQVANVSMHVESLDEEVRQRVTPGKAQIPLSTYFSAMEAAVAVFGPNRVNTYVILGLGEDQEQTLNKALALVQMGVYPNLVPLHHHPGTALENAPEVDLDFLTTLYSQVGQALNKAGLSRKGNAAGCGRCGACSLTQFTEKAE